MMDVLSHWLSRHVLHRPAPELPRDLREASHRAANESAMIRSEVVLAAGGVAEYRRKAEEIRHTMDAMMGRLQ